ncbi:MULTISPECIES: hypothetical protein [Actinosynnema]|uniref:hypothetical protein n=1 Tax=Actinosynnema TaxID=40566 RepID=UPI0020A467E2|nr:hypothetical protein [Actinosynnema pretiosum]
MSGFGGVGEQGQVALAAERSSASGQGPVAVAAQHGSTVSSGRPLLTAVDSGGGQGSVVLVSGVRR